MKNIMITTEWKGVFVAQVGDDADLTPRTLTNLKNCRMVVRWRNGEGLSGIAKYGPTSDCLLSPATDWPVLHGVTAVCSVTDDAAKKIW